MIANIADHEHRVAEETARASRGRGGLGQNIEKLMSHDGLQPRNA